MRWELVEGDPAPGSVDAVDGAAQAFLRVAELALDARNDLRSGTAGLGLGDWKGTAADTFRSGVEELPARLDEVERSYRSASRALKDFGRTLEREQHEARAALSAAEQAAADRDTARRRLDAARMERDSLRSQRIGAEAKHLALQGQRAVTLEPTQRAAVDRSVATARSRVDRLTADGRAADAAVARYEGELRAAEQRLDQAVQRAKRVRERVSSAVDDAVGDLQAAEKAGNLPNWAERQWTDAKETAAEYGAAAREAIVKYGPKVVEVLDLASTVFSLLAILPTPLAPAFATAALVTGGAALVVSLAAKGLQPGGLTGKDWADLGLRTLGLAAGGAAKLAKGASGAAAGWSTTSKVLGHAKDAGDVARSWAEDGASGAIVTAGGIVLSKVGAKVASEGLQKAVSQAHKSDRISGQLTEMSRGLRAQSETPIGQKLLAPEGVREIQSFLSHGAGTPGGALPGNHGLADPLGHALSADKLDRAVEKVAGKAISTAEKAFDGQVERAEDWAQERVDRVLDEIDIDLDPSPYGGQQ